MFNSLRVALANALMPKGAAPQRANIGPTVRMYGGAKQSRLTAGWSPANGSEDSELAASLVTLRSRSRALVRDCAYAKRARVIIVNNVIGSGVGFQAQVKSTRDKPRENINSAIEEAFEEWSRAESCHTGGALHFSDLERLLMAEVVEAGEVFVRKHYKKFGQSKVPLALEVIEPERIAESHIVPGPALAGAEVRMGIERDKFGRALAYWIRERHPSDLRAPAGASEKVERVPADQIIHLRIIDRWPQTRGVPWFHTAITRLNDMQEYTASELQAARLSAAYFGTIESDDDNPLGPGGNGSGDDAANPEAPRQYEIDAGMIQQLNSGEKFSFHSPNRPNAALDPFMRFMLREVAAGVGVSYESISRDYSQSNYSSSRLSLLEDRDLWKVFQQWWVRNFRAPLHREWLQLAVLGNNITGLRVDEYAVDQKRFECVKWKLRGWMWVDPTKEVAAYKEAVKAGFTTVTDVIAATAGGIDIEDTAETRARELKMFEEFEIGVDTTVPPPGQEPAAQEQQAPEPNAAEEDPPNDEEQATEQNPPRRVFSFPR